MQGLQRRDDVIADDDVDVTSVWFLPLDLRALYMVKMVRCKIYRL